MPEIQKEECFQIAGVLICWETNKDDEKLTSCLPDGRLGNSKKATYYSLNGMNHG